MSATSTDPLEYQIARLELGPGDVLVFKASKALTREGADRVTRAVRSILGDHQKVMILDDGHDLAVLTAAELQARMSP